MNKNILIFTIILLEGFTVLAAEILAMRQIIPFVGNATDTAAIVIGTVLLALAGGYYVGGHYTSNTTYSLRQKLCLNFLIAMAFFVPGLSYTTLDYFFGLFTEQNLTYRLMMTALYAGLFLCMPVFLLGQTVPLISRYIRSRNIGRLTGAILFFSTLGSFAGAILTPIVFMNLIGVNYAALAVMGTLYLMILLLGKRGWLRLHLIAFTLLAIGWFLNSGYMMQRFNMITMDTYHNIAVNTYGNSRYLELNNNLSAQYNDQGYKHAYITFLEQQTINRFDPDDPPRDILVIGAGGFTLGHDDIHNRYDFIDINKNLKDIAENHLLKEDIPDNHSFHAMPVRMFLNQTDKKYDVIFIDVYYGLLSIPEHLLTREFFLQVKNHLKDGGILGMNMMAAPHLSDPFSRNLDNTIRSVFPYILRHPLSMDYMFNHSGAIDNIIYMVQHFDDVPPREIYTDNKNKAFLDRQ